MAVEAGIARGTDHDRPVDLAAGSAIAVGSLSVGRRRPAPEAVDWQQFAGPLRRDERCYCAPLVFAVCCEPSG